MSATGFTPDWLIERYSIDCNSRNNHLLSLFQQALPDTDHLTLLDLGAGIGNNVRYLIDSINRNTEWILIEIDEKLIQWASKYLISSFQDQGYQVNASENVIQINNGFEHTIRFVHTSIFNLEIVPYSQSDGIVANALLDVLTQSQLETLLNQVVMHKKPALFSINYCGMNWEDDDPDNDKFTALYNKHMQRLQSKGKGLGKDIVQVIRNWLDDHRLNHVVEPSDWNVMSSERQLLNHILKFYKSSIPEILPEKSHREFSRWINRKDELLMQQLLSCTVFHQDILIHNY